MVLLEDTRNETKDDIRLREIKLQICQLLDESESIKQGRKAPTTKKQWPPLPGTAGPSTGPLFEPPVGRAGGGDRRSTLPREMGTDSKTNKTHPCVEVFSRGPSHGSCVRTDACQSEHGDVGNSHQRREKGQEETDSRKSPSAHNTSK